MLFSRMVTDSNGEPFDDLGCRIEDVCLRWVNKFGETTKLYLELQSVITPRTRATLIAEAVQELLIGGLSPSFPEKHGHIGVHLWRPLGFGRSATLLIADDGQDPQVKPLTPEVVKARRLLDQATCQLSLGQSRGVVWRIQIGCLQPECQLAAYP